MDKEEFRVKLEEINRLVEEKDYKGAMNVVDSIDWRRVKSVRTLCVVGEIYAANKRYEESRDIFLLAYHRSSIGKNILYRLIEVSLKLNDIDDAVEYYEEFCSIAPSDNTRMVLKYKILKAKDAPLEEQISILEKYREREFTEKWSYELAQLYYRAGERKKCEDLCNEMILWFSEGSYVMKALNLKQRMGVMTDAEKEKYDKVMAPKPFPVGEMKKTEQSEEESDDDKSEDSSEKSDKQIESITISKEDLNSSETLQEKITKGIRDIFGKKREAAREEEEEYEEEEVDSEYSGAEFEEVPELEQEHEVAAEQAEKKPQEIDEESEEETPDDSEEAIPEAEEDQTEETPKEEEKPAAPKLNFAQTMRMPEFKIPKSMRRIVEKKTEEEEKPVITEEILEEPAAVQETVEEAEPEKEEELPKEEPAMEFNLEDAILAAASAQGIEIPEEKPAEELPSEEELPAEEEIPEEEELPAEEEFPAEELPEEEAFEDAAEKNAEEVETVEILSEETLQEMEAGVEAVPTEELPEEEDFADFEEAEEAVQEPKRSKMEIPDLEEEDLLAEITRVSEEEIEEALVDPAVPEKVPEVKPEEPAAEELLEFPEDDFQEFEDAEELPEDAPALEESDLEVSEIEDLEDLPSFEDEDAELSDEEELERFIESMQPERDPAEIIEREKTLTEEEKKLFSYFVKVPGMENQLIDTLCRVQKEAADKTSRTGNIMIMGGSESGKTRLISGLVPAICRELNLTASKVAYVFADQINGKDLSVVLRKLSGGFFIVERANQMNPETADKLNELMELDTEGMIVILEDDKIGMRKLMQRYPKLAKKFTSLINIPVFTNDELAHFAKIYALEKGYKIDNMGMLALYNRIGSSQKADQPMNIGTVKGIVDAAIAKTQSGFFKFHRGVSKRTDRDGFRLLQEKDFK